MTGLDPADRSGTAAAGLRPPSTGRRPGADPASGTAAEPGARADHAVRLAAALHSAGVRAGHRVSLVLGPGPARSATVAACLRLGAVVVVVSPDLPAAEVAAAHAAARPDVVVGDRDGLRLVHRLRGPALRLAADRPRLADRFVGGALPLVDLVTRHLLVALPPEPDPDGDAALLFVRSDRPGEGPLGVHWTHADLDALARSTGGGDRQGPVSRGARAASVPLARDVLAAAGRWPRRKVHVDGPAPARHPALV
ncbi:AMP-binding protein [Cellulomonas pakistanensis]|uniref:AMP-dependent synthetase/ligase domain-containing protein n=1 Tax=Cellulomonas pakistanensis TaxID=992287 RepID=A0A919PDC1_9CELL|nr:AMP-binding protein [Cellulomonas pakistanensis]GIG37683.1 hypothetical protein Cpa01nite_30640 [Cellulomonas pakistanensis]